MSLSEGPKPEVSVVREESDENIAAAAPMNGVSHLLIPADPIPKVVRVSIDLSENDFNDIDGDFLDDILDADYVSFSELQHNQVASTEINDDNSDTSMSLKPPKLDQPTQSVMDSQSQSLEPNEPDQKEDSDWGWHSVKNWWNSSSLDACGKAERDLITKYLDLSIYEYQQEQILIEYDPEPVSVKKKKLERSKSWFKSLSIDSVTSKGDNQSSEYTDLGQLARSQSERKVNDYFPNDHPLNGSKSEENEEIYIHTVTFRVKRERLSELIYHLQNTDCTGNDSDNEDGPGTPHPMHPNLHSDTTPHGICRNLTQIRSEIHEIHQLNDGSIRRHKIPPIVIAHGYGMAGGTNIPSIQFIFESLLSAMSLDKSPVIHIIDWLGNGMSSRPEFQCETTEEAEDWFVESLEAWRKAMDIEKMILCGHSLGGYASCVYAMRYPQHVDHLIGISPAGIPDEEWDTDYKASWEVKAAYYLFGKLLWNSKLTIFDTIRIAGPNGKDLVKQIYIQKTLQLEEDDPVIPLLQEYLYQIMAMPPSGEYATNLILGPAARAHHPLEGRIGYLKQFQKAVTGYDYIEVIDPEIENHQIMESMKKIQWTSIDADTDSIELHHDDVMANDGIQRLKRLQTLSDHQLITEEEHEMRRRQIIDALTGTSWPKKQDDEQKMLQNEGVAMEEEITETKGDTDSESESEIDTEAVLNDSLKIDFIYGDSDWMGPDHAVKLKRKSILKCNVYINKHSGHQLMLENRKGFGRLLGSIIAKGQMSGIEEDKGHSLEDSLGNNNAEIFY